MESINHESDEPSFHESGGAKIQAKEKCDCKRILIVDDNNFNVYTL